MSNSFETLMMTMMNTMDEATFKNENDYKTCVDGLMKTKQMMEDLQRKTIAPKNLALEHPHMRYVDVPFHFGHNGYLEYGVPVQDATSSGCEKGLVNMIWCRITKQNPQSYEEILKYVANLSVYGLKTLCKALRLVQTGTRYVLVYRLLRFYGFPDSLRCRWLPYEKGYGKLVSEPKFIRGHGGAKEFWEENHQVGGCNIVDGLRFRPDAVWFRDSHRVFYYEEEDSDSDEDSDSE